MNRLNGDGMDPNNIGRTLKEKWEQEPDFVELRYGQYHLVIYRHPHLGQLNGYVGVKRNHPYFGRGMNSKQVSRLMVHGGITFAGKRVGDGFRKGYWYFGFDTAHAFDFAPLFEKMKDELIESGNPVFKELNDLMQFFSNSLNMSMGKENYKNIDYVSNEVMNLYIQLKEVENRNPNYQHNFVREYKRLRREKLRTRSVYG